MTARGKKCCCTHRQAAHNRTGRCEAFMCWCERYLARDDNDRILEMLEEVDG